MKRTTLNSTVCLAVVLLFNLGNHNETHTTVGAEEYAIYSIVTQSFLFGRDVSQVIIEEKTIGNQVDDQRSLKGRLIGKFSDLEQSTIDDYLLKARTISGLSCSLPISTSCVIIS